MRTSSDKNTGHRRQAHIRLESDTLTEGRVRSTVIARRIKAKSDWQKSLVKKDAEGDLANVKTLTQNI
jgi:hypothetical protein